MIVPPRIYLQDACLKHKYIQGGDTSHVERPERLRAVNIGIAALHARLEANHHANPTTPAEASGQGQAQATTPPAPLTIIRSAAIVCMIHHSATNYVHHADPMDNDRCLWRKLREWCKHGLPTVQQEGEETPGGLEPDLYSKSIVGYHLAFD